VTRELLETISQSDSISEKAMDEHDRGMLRGPDALR